MIQFMPANHSITNVLSLKSHGKDMRMQIHTNVLTVTTAMIVNTKKKTLSTTLASSSQSRWTFSLLAFPYVMLIWGFPESLHWPKESDLSSVFVVFKSSVLWMGSSATSFRSIPSVLSMYLLYWPRRRTLRKHRLSKKILRKKVLYISTKRVCLVLHY